MLPKKIKLGGCTVEIKHLSTDQMNEKEGEFNYEKQTIHVRNHMDEGRKEQVFVHELLHAMTDFTGLADTLESEQEEDIVNRLAPILHTFLKDNELWFK